MSGRGADRILEVIEWMAAELRPVSFSEVVNALSFPKSSTLDLLRILTEAGYVERLNDGRYEVLRLPGEPTSEHNAWGTLLRHANGPLKEAVEITGESGFVAVLGDEMGVRYIAKFLPHREILYDRDVTVARRPHLVSSGVVLLGSLSAESLASYVKAERKAGRYDGTYESLSEKVRAAIEAGIQITQVGVVEGAGGMAAPIYGRDGAIIAALNIAGPAHRLADAADQIKPVLLTASDTISRSLGWNSVPAKTATDGVV